jgi:hypothetical protein
VFLRVGRTWSKGEVEVRSNKVEVKSNKAWTEISSSKSRYSRGEEMKLKVRVFFLHGPEKAKQPA